MFFVGCFFAINGLVETFFLDNCNESAELVRAPATSTSCCSKPIDEQFLITCRKVRLGDRPQRPDGPGRDAGFAFWQMHWGVRCRADRGLPTKSPSSAARRSPTASCLLLTGRLSVWLMRNQSLMEMWWLFTSLARLPEGDLRWGRGPSAMGLSSSHSSCRSCWWSTSPAARVMVRVLDPEDGRLHFGGDRGPALAQPAVLQVRAEVLPERE